MTAENLLGNILESVPTTHPWSIAELNLSEAFYNELSCFFKNLEWDDAFGFIRDRFGCFREGESKRTAFGLLLFAFEAEHARRFCSEGALWPAISNFFRDSGYYELIFIPIGQPTAEHKALLEEAARRYKLRHVFGIEGHQNWFASIFLQIGFSKRGFERRLPEWLSYPVKPLAIEYLTGPNLLPSVSFIRVWNALYAFRKGNISEMLLRKELRMSPWVLPGWHDSLIEQARRRFYRSFVFEDYEEEELVDWFLSPPQLTWESGSRPKFSVAIENLADFDLTEAFYRVTCLNRVVAEITRQDFGAYVAVGNDRIDLDLSEARIDFTLIASSGSIADSQEIRLWNPAEDLTVFRLDRGSPIEDPFDGPMPGNSDLAMIIPSNIEVEFPDDLERSETPDRNFVFYRLPTGAFKQMRLLIDGETLWDGADLAARDVRHLSNQIRVEYMINGVVSDLLGQEVPLSIQCPLEVELRRLRVQGRPVSFTPLGANSYRSNSVIMSETDVAHGTRVSLVLSDAEGSFRVVKTLRPSGRGVIWLGPEGPTRFDPEKVLFTDTALRDRFRFLLEVNTGDDREQTRVYSKHGLVEGNLFHRRLKPHPISLGRLSGYGAALEIREGPFNAEPIEIQPVATEVIDRGIMVGLEVEDACIRIHLTHPIDPDEHHALRIWRCDGGLVEIHDASADGEDIVFPAALSFDDVAGFGFFYKGRRIGAYWNYRNWGQCVESVETDEQARDIAIILRSFKAPILSSRQRWKVRKFLVHNIHMVLPIWLSARTLYMENIAFAADPVTDDWLSALGCLVGTFGFHVDPVDAKSLVDNLAKDLENTDDVYANYYEILPLISERLVSISPRLAANVINAWEQAVCAGRPGFNHSRLHEKIRTRLTAPYSRYELLVQCTESLGGVDQMFLENAIIRPFLSNARFDPRGIKNLELALSLNSFRRLLGHDLFR